MMPFFPRMQGLAVIQQLKSLRIHKLLSDNVRCQIYKRSSHASAPQKKPLFKVIPNMVDPETEEYKENFVHFQKLEEKYKQLVALAEAGGGEKAIERHTQKNKKVLVSERLKMLFDDGEDTLELSKLAGLGMPYGNISRASVVVAIGKIQGVYCLVVANDATVKAGTVFPITVKKQLRAHEISQSNCLPTIYVVDSGGAFLPLQADIFTQGGRTFYNEAILNSMGIPQLAVVCGSCTAGAAYIPTMCQEALIVHKLGTIFLGGPPLVYAALGEVVSPEDLGGATLHSSVSGCTDYFSGTEEEAFETSRDIVATFNIEPLPESSNYDEPLYDPSELEGIIPPREQHTLDMYQVIARIVDGSRFHEFKQIYGKNLVTGFAFLQGHLVGIVGNNGSMTSDAALKGAHFVQMCSQRNIPLVFLQNSTPQTTGLQQLSPKEIGEDLGTMTKSHAKLMASVACASNVPKFTVIVGNSFGADNFMMCGRSFDPRFVFSWPNAKICIADPQQVSAMAVDSTEELAGQLDTHSSAFYSSANIWDDGVILPTDTRKVLGQCLNIVKQTSQLQSQATEYGVVRM